MIRQSGIFSETDLATDTNYSLYNLYENEKIREFFNLVALNWVNNG
jgi:hypothetical protein